MTATQYSVQTTWSVLALRRLGKDAEADELWHRVAAWLQEFERAPATIDYFATSLPNMLLFVDDPHAGRDREVARVRERLMDRDLLPSPFTTS